MRFVNALTFILLGLASSAQAQGLSCKLAKVLESPEIRDNAAFWEDFAKASTKNLSDDVVKALIEKHGGPSAVAPSVASTQAAASQSATSAVSSSATLPAKGYSLSRQAQKSVEKLPRQVATKFNEFLKLIPNGSKDLANLRAHRGGWQLQKMVDTEIFEARLNIGYRVTFDIEPGGQIHIRSVDNSTTH